MYYYFVDEKMILGYETPVDTGVFTQMVELTDEQKIFYIENPNASIREVKNLRLDKVYEPSLDEVKQNAIDYLSRLSLETSEKIVPTYKINNAITTLNIQGENTIYSTDEANRIVNDYNSIGKTCREMFYEAKGRILNCSDEEGVIHIKEELTISYMELTESNL